MAPNLLTVAELAAILKVDRSTVYRHADEWGVLRFGGALRFDLATVLKHRQRPSRHERLDLLPSITLVR